MGRLVSHPAAASVCLPADQAQTLLGRTIQLLELGEQASLEKPKTDTDKIFNAHLKDLQHFSLNLIRNSFTNEPDSTHLPRTNGNIQEITIDGIHLEVNRHFNTIQTQWAINTRKIFYSNEPMLIIHP